MLLYLFSTTCQLKIFFLLVWLLFMLGFCSIKILLIFKICWKATKMVAYFSCFCLFLDGFWFVNVLHSQKSRLGSTHVSRLRQRKFGCLSHCLGCQIFLTILWWYLRCSPLRQQSSPSLLRSRFWCSSSFLTRIRMKWILMPWCKGKSWQLLL